MYELKTLLPEFEIDVPKCMYAMKSLALSRGAVSAPSSGTEGRPPADVSGYSLDWAKNDPVMMRIQEKIDKVMKAHIEGAMTKLEDHQNEVIKKLQELRNQLNSMRSQLNISADKQTKPAMAEQEIEQPLPDIVVNAHPKYIPYALLALKNIWKDLFEIRVKCYVHSSLKTPPGADCLKFQKQLAYEKEIIIPDYEDEDEDIDKGKLQEEEKPVLPGIDVTFIWKNCEHTELITSQTTYVPIYGEVNIIRYLARVGPFVYRYDDTAQNNEIDMVLDISYQLIRATTDKTRQPLLRSLSNRLQKQTYFAGDKLTIADIAVCSSIKRTPDAEKDLNENLKNWMSRVTKIFMI